jgi:hypothetical protein
MRSTSLSGKGSYKTRVGRRQHVEQRKPIIAVARLTQPEAKKLAVAHPVGSQ